jgi:F-type H+-transporting ATPase subunit a
MAKEVLLGILAFLVVFLYSAGGVVDTVMTVVPLLLRPLIILLGLLVGFIQAFIFTLLSIVYVGGAVRTHSERSR